MKQVVLAIAVVIMVAALTVKAQETSVPPLINYQGMLADAIGNPLAGTKKLAFNIYDAATGGNLIWGPQVFDNVPLLNGRFNVILGTTDTKGKLITEAFGAKDRYLGIKVDSNSEIAPRQQVLSTPFAVRAEYAVKANLASEAEHAVKADVATTVQGTNLYIHPDTDNVGIGTNAPTKKVEINGTLGFTGGQGPFCIFANECPNGWINKGSGGYITGYGECSYIEGSVYTIGWKWCHPKICCNE